MRHWLKQAVIAREWQVRRTTKGQSISITPGRERSVLQTSTAYPNPCAAFAISAA